MERFYTEHQIPQPAPPACQNHQCLRGQKALVTGASSGIGRAIAIELGKAGADVCVNYAGNKQKGEETVETIREAGGNAFVFRADVSKEEDILAMFEAIETEFGRIDIMVANAGIQKDAPLTEMTVEQWNQVIGVNLTGQFLCSREAVRAFKRQGVQEKISCAAGKIVCVSSVHDVIPWAGHVNYAASKGGVSMMMKSIAQEVAQFRIRVNCLSPGAVRTPINTEAWNTPEAYEDLMRLVPYKRIGEPQDIGRATVWLASDNSDYVNGATLYVDGGMTLYPGFETGG